jgi:hypothetical protein
MLRVIKKPAKNKIYEIQKWVEHLVCEVWCKADTYRCSSKLNAECKVFYEKYGWLKRGINKIYSQCKTLTKKERNQINDAFLASNNIEGLCNGSVQPVYLKDLPAIVESAMKPFLIKFYEDLLERKSVPGTKREYYKAIQDENSFANCPCCGYIPFQNVFSSVREDLDHFFPKAHYPFASVNFNNLSPLCNKCNTDFKRETDPVKNKNICFYNYETVQPIIKIDVDLDSQFLSYAHDVMVNDTKNKPDEKLVKIKLSGKDQKKIDRWNELYSIDTRYKDRVETFTYSVLRRLKLKQIRSKGKYAAAIDADIEECKGDIFIHEHFLQIPFMESLKPILV